ncbi:conserved Plasmodium protein, unknown function [Plasmodium knowlesi strain H]|uniref:Uncharacterized protein n=3 Tax=Plasmodium knowlesi TaxID=5850 RepID=A0A5K1UFW9_PLAKH|nr:conserved Plasmodium protein, unknown function [Plasmodium knowlesi strain H]OTN68562.1 Uncharacterized protein PKNOH_S02302200 [Plasmodium knowlesi]CAA9986523.1 conserved Plasmodium protein, unknown function [Plasmodium knowlesi strain H]SBO24214.1 conserved Plasmodium protein, unknown function [Plasmodium knowlesi strain H]SBO29770.1 conserved Plasmodium protein, unknown function [Plasmodium knowlesi strain H]VVS75997.1 conserved Plasmodium protein, unknown function [Plasmodium knowlesi s|eukprot:XP_002261074.1 hypothetical protein, conserved in Plasmodium species [Plasmodium knowlesi strain H]
MTGRLKNRKHGGTIRTMNHHEETRRTGRKGIGEEEVSMENIKTLYHIFSSADRNYKDGGNREKSDKGIHGLKASSQNEGAMMVSPRSNKNDSSKEEVNGTKRANEEKEFLNRLDFSNPFGQYSCFHPTDVEKRKKKKDNLPFQQSVEVTQDWDALQRVDNLLCDSSEKEETIQRVEFFYNFKGKMQRGGSHLKYHNVGERKDISSGPTEGKKSEESQRRQPYRGETTHLRRDENPSHSNQTGVVRKNGFVNTSNGTSIYDALISMSRQMENESTHFDKSFDRNNDVHKLLDLEHKQSNHERKEPLGGAKITPLNWDRNYSALNHLQVDKSEEEVEISKGESSMKTVLPPKRDILKCNEKNVNVEREENPFLKLIEEENSPDEVPLFEDHSYMEDLTSAIFNSHANTNNEKDKKNLLGESILKRSVPIQMDDLQTRDVSSLENENIFGELTNCNAMERGGQVDVEAVRFTKELPISGRSLLEGEFQSNLFHVDGDHSSGRKTKGGRLHMRAGTKDEQTYIDDEDFIGRDNKVDIPNQWGNSPKMDIFQMVNRKRGDNTPDGNHMKVNSSMGRIKLHEELINLSDGSTSEMGWTCKETPYHVEPNVGWLSMEKEYPVNPFNMIGEEKREGSKKLPLEKYDFFHFEPDMEVVDAPQRGSLDSVEDISNRMTRHEDETTKGVSHVGLFTDMPHERNIKIKEKKKKEKEEDALAYDDQYITEQRMMEEDGPMEDECSSFLDIIDEIVNISKDIIGTNQNEDGVVEILQKNSNECIDSSQIGEYHPEGNLAGDLHMGFHLDVDVGSVVEPYHESTYAGVYKDSPEHKIVDDVYFHFDQLSESCKKREEDCDEVIKAKEGKNSIDGIVQENLYSVDVNVLQVEDIHWINRSDEREGDTSGIYEEKPQESLTCEATAEGADLPTIQLCEELYRVLICRNYLEALPVLLTQEGGKRADWNPINGTFHCDGGNYPSDRLFRGNINLITFQNYLRRAKKMNKRGFNEMYDYTDYVYTHIRRILRMDITRFFFISNYLENMNRYIIKKNRLINDLTNAQNFVNDFLQKKENVITQKRFCNDITYPMYFLIFTNLLVTLWHTSLCHLDEANWSRLIHLLIRCLRKKRTIHILRRSYSHLSRIYRYLTKHALDEKGKKKIIRIVKRSKSFKEAQKNVHTINTFCFYVLIIFLPLSVPPFGKDLNTRDYFLHCFLRSMNKVVLRYAKDHTNDGLTVSPRGKERGEAEHNHSDGPHHSRGSHRTKENPPHTHALPSQSRTSENMRNVVRKAVKSSQKNICLLKMQSLAQVFRFSFEDAPLGGRPKRGSTRSNPNRNPKRQPKNLSDTMRDIHISARIEQIEKELIAYLSANAHFYDTFFNIIAPMLNDLTILLDNLEAIFALYVKHKVWKSKKLLFFRNPWLCGYDVFLSFNHLGGSAPNQEQKNGIATVTNRLADSLSDDSSDNLPSDLATYMAQQDNELVQDDLVTLYDVRRLKKMLLLGGRKKGKSRRNTDGSNRRRYYKQKNLADGDRPNKAKLKMYYSYILKLCQDERYKEINTRALKCLFYSFYFS